MTEGRAQLLRWLANSTINTRASFLWLPIEIQQEMLLYTRDAQSIRQSLPLTDVVADLFIPMTMNAYSPSSSLVRFEVKVRNYNRLMESCYKINKELILIQDWVCVLSK